MAADLPTAAPAEAPAAAVARAPVAAEPIYVDSHNYRYAVTGNTLLSRDKVEAAIKSAAEPRAALEALNKAYTEAGYFLIVIGGQVDKQLVAFTVLQGRVSELDAPDALRPYFRGVMNRDDLTQNKLILESAFAEIYSAREGLRPKAAFAPAQQVGGTKLTITEEPIPESKRWSAGLALNNLGGRFSSRYTWGGSAAVRPGGGTELTANYLQGIPQWTSDSAGATYQAGGLGASVVTPWGLYGVNYSQTRYQTGVAGAPVFPAGEIMSAAVTGTQLVYADPTSRLSVNEAFTRYANLQSGFEGLFNIVDQRYSVATLGAAYNAAFAFFGRNSSFNASVTLQKGLSPRSGTFVPADPGVPDPHFLLTQGTMNVALSLPYGLTAGASVSGQYTHFVLPQSQQWVLGGFGNLSAWLPAVILGDSGALGRFTISSPPWQWSQFTTTAAAFAEAGVARLEQRAIGDPRTRSLADAGLQLAASTSTGTSLTLAYGWPVWYRNIEGVTRSNVDRDRAKLYFTLNQSF